MTFIIFIKQRFAKNLNKIWPNVSTSLLSVVKSCHQKKKKKIVFCLKIISKKKKKKRKKNPNIFSKK